MDEQRNAIELTKTLLRFGAAIRPVTRRRTRLPGDLLADAGFRVSYHPSVERWTCVVASPGGNVDEPPLRNTGHRQGPARRRALAKRSVRR
jgi:hypothetical protein